MNEEHMKSNGVQVSGDNNGIIVSGSNDGNIINGDNNGINVAGKNNKVIVQPVDERDKIYSLDEISDKRPLVKFKISVIANIVAFIADIISIILAFNEIKSVGFVGFADSVSVEPIFIFTLISSVLFVFNVMLIRTTWFSGIKKEGNTLYIVKPKRCPKCGGKLVLAKDDTAYVCRRQYKHRFQFDYTK